MLARNQTYGDTDTYGECRDSHESRSDEATVAWLIASGAVRGRAYLIVKLYEYLMIFNCLIGNFYFKNRMQSAIII